MVQLELGLYTQNSDRLSCVAALYTEGLSSKLHATNGAQRLMNRT